MALQPFTIRLAKEGLPIVAVFVAVTLLLFLIWEVLGWIGVVLTLWCVYFFRDPDRFTPQSDKLVISPADGVVQMIKKVVPPEELEMGDDELTRISVFMNVFNVHVNRVPANGKIKRLSYRPGKFFNASLDKASEHNERQCVLMETTDGREIAFVQIAGLVARRIKCTLSEGEDVKAGERFGIIRFGSRVDVYLPEGVEPKVLVGQTMVAGETVIAEL